MSNLQSHKVNKAHGYKNLKGDKRKAVKTKIDLIQWELYNWVILQPQEHYSKLPANSCGRHSLGPGDHYNVLLRVRVRAKSYIQFFSVTRSIFGTRQIKFWDKPKGETFAVRLQSSSVDGLNLSSLRGRYIVQYKNALIGKHFKILQQLSAFHLHDDLGSKNLFSLTTIRAPR
ncbi:hypothetical protein B0H14DRAFT_2647113 [Mycena olivaceomarginata]|nr:hypothetical protein B0H14DRAFT_2647113 [Mycena olivaceomarginata]